MSNYLFTVDSLAAARAIADNNTEKIGLKYYPVLSPEHRFRFVAFGESGVIPSAGRAASFAATYLKEPLLEGFRQLVGDVRVSSDERVFHLTLEDYARSLRVFYGDERAPDYRAGVELLLQRSHAAFGSPRYRFDAGSLHVSDGEKVYTLRAEWLSATEWFALLGGAYLKGDDDE